MTKVTYINKYRAKRQTDIQPDVVCEDGFYKFCAEYKDASGHTMTFHVWATSWEDAEIRLQSIKHSAKISGLIEGE